MRQLEAMVSEFLLLRLLLISLYLSFLPFLIFAAPTPPHADFFLKGGKIYTDAYTTSTWSEALTIRNGKIKSIGKIKDLEKELGPKTRIISLYGKLVLPGFNDAHIQEIHEQNLDELLSLAKKNGVTSLQGRVTHGEKGVRLIEKYYNEKKLTVRISIWGDLEKPEEFQEMRKKQSHLPEEWIRFDALEGRIETEPNSLRYSQNQLNDLVFKANRAGIPVVLQISTESGFNAALRAFAHSKQKLFNSKLRNRIENPSIIPKASIGRLFQNNVSICGQPQAFELNWFSLANHDIHFAFGSGWPQYSIAPLLSLKKIVQSNARIKDSKERLPFDRAFQAYTLGSAVTTNEDHLKGSIREGKYADLVIFEKNFFERPLQHLDNNAVYMTFVGGKLVYDGWLEQAKSLPTSKK